MKKILFAAFAALFTLGMVSCQGNGDEPEKKNPIVLVVDSVSQEECYISITPSDTLAMYYINALPKAMTVGKTTEEVVKTFKAQLDFNIEAFATVQGDSIGYAYFGNHGVHQFKFYSLSPSTDYVVYAYYLDTLTGLAIGDVCSVPFRTKEIEILGEKEVQMTEVYFQWDARNNSWEISAMDAEQNYGLVIFSQVNSPKTGTFTIENGGFYNTLFLVGGKLYKFVELTVVIKALEGDLYQIAIDGVASDGYRYHITMDPVPLVPMSDQPTAPARKAPRRAAIECVK